MILFKLEIVLNRCYKSVLFLLKKKQNAEREKRIQLCRYEQNGTNVLCDADDNLFFTFIK